METVEAADATAEAAREEGTARADAADAASRPRRARECGEREGAFPARDRGKVPGHGDWRGLETARAGDVRRGGFHVRFLGALSGGDDWECVWDTLDNALRRTGKPCDVLGLYKEVCSRGGFLDRESAKRRIKMGYAFMQTHNFYRHHTYTDIGNKLLDLYERILLPYENEHPEDITREPCVTCGDAGANASASKTRCDACAKLYHRRCAGEGAFARASRVERFTSCVCAACVQSASSETKTATRLSVASRVVTVFSRDGKRTQTKRTLAEIDERNGAALDDALARSVAMRVRRGRVFEADFSPPTRHPDSIALDRRGEKDTHQTEKKTQTRPASTLVGPAL